jgi:glycosyltransferase involved in cell wall biosynthesis
MRILLCCELYSPSVGGVQVVMQHLGERLTGRGHDVTVATTRLPDRDFSELNGVHLQEFSVSGNFVSGLRGEVKAYQDYVVSGHFDVVMIKAAQQWTFDALWPVLDHLTAAKVFIPCGFSSFYEPFYSGYFKRLPQVLKKFDRLIFYATDYRDINFAREHGIEALSIVSNGACEIEFSATPDPAFRSTLGIAPEEFVFLTVGSFTGLKGHLEVATAFVAADLEGRSATLVLNGNRCLYPDQSLKGQFIRALGVVKTCGVKYFVKHTIKVTLRSFGIKVGKEDALDKVLEEINRQEGKTVLVTDLPRAALIQAFMTADLFVFASNVEYSPLVLFESAAAGTPFLTVPVGNSEEIAHWTEAGVVCPAPRDHRGYTRVDSQELALWMSKLANDPERLKKLGDAGQKNWEKKFTWEKISETYEAIFQRILEKKVTEQ